MANKRTIKKQIRYLCGDLAAETIIAGYMIEGFTPHVVSEIVNDIAHLQVESLAHATFAFDKSCKEFDSPAKYHAARAAYYRKGYAKLRSDLREGTEAIIKKMNQARG